MLSRIIAAAAFTIFFGVVSLFIVGYSFLVSTQNGYVYTEIVVVAILIIGNLYFLGLLARLTKRARWAVPALILTLPLAVYGGYEAYINHIEINNAEVDLTAYEPFENGTKAVSLDGKADFSIDSRMPLLDGATALYPVMASFIQAVYPEQNYPHDNPLESEAVASKTGNAFARLAKKEVDIIFTAGPSEVQEAALKDMEMTPIGKEAFVFFVHESNPVESLTIKQLQQIYSGEITNWKEVGGKDKEIIAFQRPEGSGSQTGLQNMMGDTPIMTPPTDQKVDGMGGVIEKASNYRNYRNAIGFSYRFFATGMVESKGIKLLKVNDVEPDIEGIQSGKYPLTGEFYAITNGTINPNVKPFIEWILSEQGQQLIEKTGYVPIKEK
ncbi:PstS family phosphate ABC transporter substrate-binding protein [Bacillus salacetis]|uniref:PstS family phosphate ABC transporter substrate-binding protein n=1 Tax=Bacillus salacetis TaxID=2315464 RepID=UPI003B9E2B89